MTSYKLDNRQHTALITGATGFVGSMLTRKLLATGWRVHVLVRPSSNFARLHDLLDGITVHVYDGTIESLRQIIADMKPGVIFHLASYFVAQHQPEDISSLIASNVLFGTQLLEAVAALCGVCLIHTGTYWQHFEDASYNPVCLYAATKQAFEDILRYYTEVSSVRAIGLHLFDVYGPHDPRAKIFSLLHRLGIENKPLLMSPGEQLMDFVYIDDVVVALEMAAQLLLANEGIRNETYAVSSGKPIPLREVVELYCATTNKTLPIIWGGRSYRPREVMRPWSTGQLLPGWAPVISLEEGIRLIEGARIAEEIT